MHSKYIANASATQAQVMNDIALLITGSPLSALSSGCDKVNSTLISTVAPGWTLVDSAAPSGVVISAPDIDGLTTKYVRLYAFSTTQIDMMAYEGWNATAHTGTNASTGAGFAGSSVNPNNNTYLPVYPYFGFGSSNTFWIFATPRMCYVMSSGGGASAVGSFEFSRDCEYLKATNYPCFGVTSPVGIVMPYIYTPTQSAIAISRTKNLGATGDLTGASATAISGSVAGRIPYSDTSYRSGSPSAALVDASGNFYNELRSIWAMSLQRYNFDQPILGKFFDVLEIGRYAGNTFDTVVVNGIIYMIVRVINANGSYPNIMSCFVLAVA